jgi:DNA polymerase III alpha subunit (gram-positive type)
LRLGLERHPEIKTKIQNSPEIAQRKAGIQEFLGDLPIVAHNARFDSAFLKPVLGEFTNPVVDTMEMAILLFPHLTKYKLEQIASHLNIDYRRATEVWQKTGQEQVYLNQIAPENLHDAVTDTCLLAVVYQKLYTLW